MKLAILIFLVLIHSNVSAATKNTQTEDPLVELAILLSKNDSAVVNEVRLFASDKSKYFDARKQDLLNSRFIESKDEITSEIVLVDALLREGFLVYVDWKQDPSDVLEQVLALSENRLENSSVFEPLSKHYRDTQYGIGEFFDEKGDWPSIFDCASDVDLSLMAINEGSDSYALFLAEKSSEEHVIKAFKGAKVSLYNFRGKTK